MSRAGKKQEVAGHTSLKQQYLSIHECQVSTAGKKAWIWVSEKVGKTRLGQGSKTWFVEAPRETEAEHKETMVEQTHRDRQLPGVAKSLDLQTGRLGNERLGTLRWTARGLRVVLHPGNRVEEEVSATKPFNTVATMG